MILFLTKARLDYCLQTRRVACIWGVEMKANCSVCCWRIKKKIKEKKSGWLKLWAIMICGKGGSITEVLLSFQANYLARRRGATLCTETSEWRWLIVVCDYIRLSLVRIRQKNMSNFKCLSCTCIYSHLRFQTMLVMADSSHVISTCGEHRFGEHFTTAFVSFLEILFGFWLVKSETSLYYSNIHSI